MICNDSIVFCTIIVSLARLQFFKFSLQSSVYFFSNTLIISRRQNISVHLIQKQCVHYFDSIGQSYLCWVLIVVGISQWLKKVYRLFCREAEGSCCERCREQCVRKKLWWGRNSCCVVEQFTIQILSRWTFQKSYRNKSKESKYIRFIIRVCCHACLPFWSFLQNSSFILTFHVMAFHLPSMSEIHFYTFSWTFVTLLNFVKFLKINFLSSSSSRKYLQYLSPNFTVFIRIVSFRCIA